LTEIDSVAGTFNYCGERMVPRKRHVRGRRGVETGTASHRAGSFFIAPDARFRYRRGSFSVAANDAGKRSSRLAFIFVAAYDLLLTNLYNSTLALIKNSDYRRRMQPNLKATDLSIKVFLLS
jgi:hypothetical protein